MTRQPFTIDINTFPGVKGEFIVYHVDTLNFDGDGLLADNSKTVRWDSYEPVFKLVTGFIENWDL